MSSKYIPSVLKKKLLSGKKEKVIEYLETAGDIIQRRLDAQKIMDEYNLIHLFDKYRKNPVDQQKLKDLADLKLDNKEAKKVFETLREFIDHEESVFLDLSISDREKVMAVFQEHWDNGIRNMRFMDQRLPALLELMRKPTFSYKTSANGNSVSLDDPTIDIYDLKDTQYNQVYDYGNWNQGSKIQDIELVWSVYVLRTNFHIKKTIIKNGAYVDGLTTEQGIHWLNSPTYKAPYINERYKDIKNAPEVIQNYQMIK